MSTESLDVPAKKAKTDNSKCCRCSVYLRKIAGTKETISESEVTSISSFLNKNVTAGDQLCPKCKKIIGKALRNMQETKRADYYEAQLTCSQDSFHLSLDEVTPSNSQAISESTDEYTYNSPQKVPVEYIEMPFPRVVSTHKYCCLCHEKKNIVLIPFDARMQVFAKMRIMIPNGNRCCKAHLIKKRFYDEELQNINAVADSCSMDVQEVAKFMEQLSIEVDSSLHDKIGNYSMSDEKLKVLTSLNWENINMLAELLTSMRTSESRTVVQALVVFLFKLRSGNSNKLISTVLGLEREQQVSDFITSVLNSFEKDVLPNRFGFQAFSREYFIDNHTAIVAKKLHNVENNLMIICDGTYYRHQKSKNNDYQRKSYSVQKGLPLCKPFTICTTDGFVIDVPGPYYANQNDATILRDILSKTDGLKSLLKDGDVFVLDRGFRDVKNELETDGYKVLMPAFKGKQKQLSTKQSNESRLVTKIRWPVESVHGVLGKKYNLLHNQLDNKLLPKVGSLCKVACYLNNTFGKRLNSDQDMVQEVVDQINNRKDVENTLANEIDDNKWNRKTVPFKQITSDDL